MSPKAEVLLSYLQGLAPVGETIAPALQPLMHDLGYRHMAYVYENLRELLGEHCVTRLTTGRDGTLGLLIVQRRVEHLPPRPTKPLKWFARQPDEPRKKAGDVCRAESRVTADDFAARLSEIPPDTRTLTARIMGDPLIGRRAIDKRAAR